MYKHILIATDGSEIAGHAVAHGLKLAKAVGAKVTAMMVTLPWTAVAYGEMAVALPPQEYEAGTRKNADKVLNAVVETARGMGVQCDTQQASDFDPYQAILAAAQKDGCDLVVMGSHGRRGLSRMLLGSETVKVLTHSKIPVLVWRE